MRMVSREKGEKRRRRRRKRVKTWIKEKLL
jgi:hypothetical protein